MKSSTAVGVDVLVFTFNTASSACLFLKFLYIDGVSSKIIKYLDEVRAEQAEQKRLINILQSSQAESSF